jgi:hypothetical protein
LPKSISIRSVPAETNELLELMRTEPSMTCGQGTSDKVVSPLERF